MSTNWTEHHQYDNRRDEMHGLRISMGRFVTLLIGDDLAKRFDLKPGSRVRLYFSEDNRGRIVKSPDTKGYSLIFAGKRKRGGQLPDWRIRQQGFSPLMMRFIRPKGWTPENHRPQRLTVRVVDGGMEFILPDWALVKNNVVELSA